jgi:class 3 adenylate cyclase
LIDPTIAIHHGRVVKRTGDGILVEFRSVVDAVRCAIEIQNGMAEQEQMMSDKQNEDTAPLQAARNRSGARSGKGAETRRRGALIGDDVVSRAVRTGADDPVEQWHLQLLAIFYSIVW